MYRLIEFGSSGVEWRDIHNAEDAYAMQDSIIEAYLWDGYETFRRPLMHKGVGHTYQWVEIHLVRCDSGVPI